MLSNAFPNSIKLACRGPFHALLCSRICLTYVVKAQASRAEICLFLPDVLIQGFSQSCMDDLAEDVAGNGKQSDTSLVVALSQITRFGWFDNKSSLDASGLLSLSHYSLNMPIKRRGVSSPSALSISAANPSAPPAFPLLIALMAAFTSSRVGGSTQIVKSSTAGGISATWDEHFYPFYYLSYLLVLLKGDCDRLVVVNVSYTGLKGI